MLVSALFASLVAAVAAARPAVVVDTDIFSDVDDVGALAIVHVLHNAGAIDLRGLAVDTPSRFGPLALAVLNTYYGNDDVPIAAALGPPTDDTFVDTWQHRRGEFAARLAMNFPRPAVVLDPALTPVALYRRVLAEAVGAAEPHGITLVSLGFLGNLAALLDSPADAVSPLDGPALVAAAVAELVVMGGAYPAGHEFNFAGFGGGGGVTAREAAAAAQRVVNHWPRSVPVTYAGAELGQAIVSAQTLAQHAPPDSPVLAAYQWYVGRCETGRESWDPVAALYACLGLSGRRPDDDDSADTSSPLFAYGNTHGYNTVADDGSNRWVDDPSVTNQHWLRLADGIANTTVAWVLDQYYAHAPDKPAAAADGYLYGQM